MAENLGPAEDSQGTYGLMDWGKLFDWWQGPTGRYSVPRATPSLIVPPGLPGRQTSLSWKWSKRRGPLSLHRPMDNRRPLQTGRSSRPLAARAMAGVLRGPLDVSLPPAGLPSEWSLNPDDPLGNIPGDAV